MKIYLEASARRSGKTTRLLKLAIETATKYPDIPVMVVVPIEAMAHTIRNNALFDSNLISMVCTASYLRKYLMLHRDLPFLFVDEYDMFKKEDQIYLTSHIRRVIAAVGTPMGARDYENTATSLFLTALAINEGELTKIYNMESLEEMCDPRLTSKFLYKREVIPEELPVS